MDKVLIVDDDEQLLLILTEILEKYRNRFEVVPVNSGFEAISALRREKFSLLITDLVMAGINGLVLLSYMTKNFPRVPCIVMTGHGTPELQERLEKEGRRLIRKPFSVTELGELILSILGKEQILLGTMNGVSISGFLKLVETEAMTCICEIQALDGRTGYLVFEGGDLYNAAYGKFNGRRAALELFRFDRVKIRFRNPPKKKFPRKIQSSIEELLKETGAG
ncbi:MAG: response regulator [Desulfobulbaceae bacterium]|nr:response regulator [Desulfobulbaceae bacterium]MDY0350577.1 response regulator [Desulfobulbaceae bacterium]